MYIAIVSRDARAGHLLANFPYSPRSPLESELDPVFCSSLK